MNSCKGSAIAVASTSRPQCLSAPWPRLRKVPGGARAAIVMHKVRFSPSFAHRAEGDAAQQMAAQQNGEAQDRDEEQRGGGGDRRPVLAALADDEGDEGRHGLRVTAGEQDRKGIFVPGK